MPKKKKNVSASESETSDSGPDDPQPAKKSKPDPKTKKKSYADEEEPSWTLDTKRFLKVREFRGKLMVDIREYYEKDGELLPGKKGISLSAIQWKKLVSVVDEVEDCLKQKS